jgi:N-acetylglucosamine kinase-like BadF-type ATPase
MLLVGIDGGASHTEAIAAQSPDRVLARWQGEPSAVRPGTEPDAARILSKGVAAVLEQAGQAHPPRAIVAGVAGAGRDDVRTRLEELLAREFADAAVTVTTDGAIALEAAFPEGRPGIVVTAGSGSVAYARDPRGGVKRAGGLGWQMGDEGSGYALARAALEHVGRATDGRSSKTDLTARLLLEIGASSGEELMLVSPAKPRPISPAWSRRWSRISRG